MLSFNRMKKGLAILLVVLFVVSLTAVAASAERSGGGYGGHGDHGNHRYYDSGHGYDGYYNGYSDWGGYGGYTGCGWVNGAWVCPIYGYPYIWMWKCATWLNGNGISMKTKTAKWIDSNPSVYIGIFF